MLADSWPHGRTLSTLRSVAADTGWLASAIDSWSIGLALLLVGRSRGITLVVAAAGYISAAARFFDVFDRAGMVARRTERPAAANQRTELGNSSAALRSSEPTRRGSILHLGIWKAGRVRGVRATVAGQRKGSSVPLKSASWQARWQAQP